LRGESAEVAVNGIEHHFHRLFATLALMMLMLPLLFRHLKLLGLSFVAAQL